MADRSPLPPGFRFGVATAGYCVEGGYNGPGEPANNWSWWEAEGRIEPSGLALDFWHRFEQHLDAAAAMGCDAFRMSVEWTRCEPFPGAPDEAAFDRYARILDACHDRKLQPLVALHHFCHPAWLGADFWLRLDAPERFREWVVNAVDRFAGRCRHWITLTQIVTQAVRSYVTGAFPPGRRLDIASALRALDHMLAAHVLAYEAIKERQPQAVVTTASHPRTIYELDRLLSDVLLARSQGVARHDLRVWLRQRREQHHHHHALAGGSVLEEFLRRRVNSAVPLEMGLPRAVAAVYAGAHARPLDVAALDHDDPAVHRRVRPSVRPGSGRSGGLHLTAAPWERHPDPAALRRACHAGNGLDVVVSADGLCNRVVNGRRFPRSDGWNRPAFLRAQLAAVLDAVDSGAPVTGYYHWTLADAYEWGTYQARYGLHGVDRERGQRWSERDSMGAGSARAYRRIIEGLREGDRSVLA